VHAALNLPQCPAGGRALGRVVSACQSNALVCGAGGTGGAARNVEQSEHRHCCCGSGSRSLSAAIANKQEDSSGWIAPALACPAQMRMLADLKRNRDD
jgi:hypothetical protein